MQKKIPISGLTFIVGILVATMTISCIPQKRIIYLQDKQATGNELASVEKKYTLKPGDMLYVRVITSNPEISELFNIDERGSTYYATQNSVGNPRIFLYGYYINQEGNIKLPVIGDVKVAGFTIAEVHEIIQKRTEVYLVDATVSVRLINFKVTVLGEVNRPGTFNIYDETFTVMDAIGVAGDMTDYGNRKVHIIRKTDDGHLFERLDIADREAALSGFYYLQPNDVIYIQPMLSKRFALAQFPYGAFFSAISTIILLLNFIQ